MSVARGYHDATKHHFHGFARSLGYLDWATQPEPFRRFAGAPERELARTPGGDSARYSDLFSNVIPPASITEDTVGELLRYSVGLSAWKQYGESRWALRVNPSSGNLHPTEAYVIHGGVVGHYAPDRHVLEVRAELGSEAWEAFAPSGEDGFIIALTSVVWREAWKYGERAYRYCQHDLGHALGAVRMSAAALGWRCRVLPTWSDEALTSVLGLDQGDWTGVEPEEPACALIVTVGDPAAWCGRAPDSLVGPARRAVWLGAPNRLSIGHVAWPRLEEIAQATRFPGATVAPDMVDPPMASPARRHLDADDASARRLMLQRRSAVAFDGRSALTVDALAAILERLVPGAPPWDVLTWSPQVHLALFIHRVEGLTPGIYAYVRSPHVTAEWRAAMRPEFVWEEVRDRLFLLAPVDVRESAQQLSCNQSIAGDGFMSLAMVARFDASIAANGEWFYRRLFWECGVIGQVLYLEAEAAGARSTGIGCYFDDPVHDVLGLTGHDWQSLYHFSMGMPVEDDRLMTSPGYTWG